MSARRVDRADVRSVRRRRLLLATVVLLTVGAAGWAVWFSSYVSVHRIRVDGGTPALATQVQRAGAGALGRPLVRVDTGAVRRSVAALGEVEQVEVSRSFPSTLVVHVTPRTPVLLARTPDGALHLIDSHGTPYGTVARPDGSRLPIVPVPDVRNPASKPGLNALVAVMDALGADLRPQVSGVAADRSGWVTFTLSGLQVRWGDADDGALKARALRTMLPTAATEKARVLDISSPERPVLS
ncbi:FtsQ-type POTRA domain-containing protein [Luteipulveratus sp. YIM 133132]|uniref:FtsQ-type POTRA domain-containing protein n=1 Tax=Luteipulveratus flavus TaxID=3031728 RepID=A0ABT6C5S4_9MICO|nr:MULTISPECIES: FtsQ-type POTRA domain-containing protein [unclassified Luteipulveratus]MDE9366481.1 FtsQ-type POTRA domain-containing protein [Luteipulveratus sp. YIM 133132]MDF8264245.1 FtsQ-type POTRA domain-containing protein [Luteipulveratus sp. YIM 133296]